MAETFIAIASSIGSAVATTGTAISTFFTGGAAAGTAASSISSALSIGSALASIAGGVASAQAAKDQAQQVAIQDAQRRAQDSQERASIAKEYADLLSEQEAVQIANGLNPGVGTPASVRRATTEVAERNLSISRENTRNRTRVSRLQQRSLMKSGQAQLLGSFVQAGGTMASNYQAVG